MPQIDTLGRLLLKDAVPDDLKDAIGTMDKKNTGRLYQAIAELYPDKYREIAKKISDISTRAGYESGGYSFGIEDMQPHPETAALRRAFEADVARVLSDKTLSPKMRDAALVKASLEHGEPIRDSIMTHGLAQGNPLAMQVASGAKGKPENLKALVAGDSLYQDQNFNPVPFPITRSFAEGLTPAQYFAGTFGARYAIAQTKLGTAGGGYLAKRLSNSAHRLLVSSHDGDDRHATTRGYPVALDEPDNEGALLAHPVEGYSRDTVLTRDVIADLKRRGVKDILARSPLIGGPDDGGVYGKDVGVRERGRIAPVGDYVGLAAAQSISEPMTQLIIGCLAQGTEVRMADWSVKPIEKIAVGDRVLGADMSGQTFPVDVTWTFDNGTRPCVRTSFGFGKRNEELVLDSTADHKLLATTIKSSCKEEAQNGVLRQLPVGKVANRFYAQPGTGFDDSGLVSDSRALMLGLLLGDGCFTESMSWNVFLSCADELLATDLAPYLAAHNLRLHRCQSGGGLMYRFSQIVEARAARDATTGRMVSGARNPARAMLEQLNLLGKYSYEKTIPDAVYTWDNASIGALLAGLIITDGSVYQTRAMRLPFVAFGSTSRRMVEQFRELVAWRFGIHFGPVDVNKSARKRELYAVELAKFSDVKALRQHLPLLGVKRQRYDDLVAQAEAATAQTGVRNRGRLDAPFRYKRKSQVVVGDRSTYDIEVDHPDHLFVLANGLIVSNSKHTGGVAGASKGQKGFPVLDQLTTIPSTFPGGAVHAQHDGLVTSIREAPQGGNYIAVDGKEHYARPDLEITAKPGDKVEAGDILTDGIENPAEYVKHKGIGEGRRRFVDVFRRLAGESGFHPHRRNLELVTRGLIDHVRVEKEFGDHLPGDVISYTPLEHHYDPRPGSRDAPPKELLGHYLERPVLHHTIGTQIKPSMLPAFEKYGVESVTAHAEPPPFSPVMVRSQDVVGHDPDPFARMLGSNTEKNLLRGVHRGDESDPMGTSYAAALGPGVDFGQKGKTVGWKPA